MEGNALVKMGEALKAVLALSIAGEPDNFSNAVLDGFSQHWNNNTMTGKAHRCNN